MIIFCHLKSILSYNHVLCSFLLLSLSVSAQKKVTVRILQTTDIHSYIDEGDNVGQGGWLRVASMIKKHRKEFGRENTLLIDSGDTIQGSLSGILSRGEAAVDLLNHLEYDAWVLGNHELDFGVPQLHRLLSKVKVPVYAGNFSLLPPYEGSFRCWDILEKNGARICIIGMQASYLKEWFKGRLFKKYEVKKAYDVLLEEMPKILKEKPDMIILALHQGFLYRDTRGVNEIKEIAQRFPEIDLMLGGHTHQPHTGKNVYGVYYSQAAYHASHLGVIDAEIDLEKGEVIKIESRLESAGSEIEKDKAAQQIYLKWQNRVKEFAGKTVCTLKKDISSRGTPGISCAISSLIAQSIKKEAQSDFAIHGKFTNESLKAEVTEYDIYKVIPYENYIFKLSVNRDQLKKIMVEQLKFLNSRSFNAPEGFKVILDKTKSKVLKLELPLNKEKYTLAVNSRVAAGGGGRYAWLKQEIEEGRIPVEEVEVNAREAVRKHLIQLRGEFYFHKSVEVIK